MKFLSLEKEIFGLDISDRSIKVINLKKKKNSFDLVSLNELELIPGVIEGGVIKNEDGLAQAIKVLIKTVKGKKIKTKYVAVSLPEEKSFLQVIQMPKMEEWELKSAVIFEVENYIPLPVSEVYMDFQTIVPLKEQPNHSDVLIVATPKKIVNSYVSCLKKAGLIPLILEVESQAIARALVKNEINDAPIAIVDLGKSSTVFIIFAGRSIQFTCSIPISSDQLTQALSASFNITADEAENIKREVDLSNMKTDTKDKKIIKATNPILEELIKQIEKYLNFYQAHAPHDHLSYDGKIQKILLCGGGANLQGLSKLLSEKLGISVEPGNFWENFSMKKNHPDVSQNHLSFVTALGLALRGIHDDAP